MADSLPVLVLISEDPRTSHRANEAMRIALGIVAGENDVTIVLTGPAVHLLDAETDDLVDGDDIARHRTALAKLGIPFHVDASTGPANANAADWNAEGRTTVAVARDEIAALIARARRVLIF